MTRTPNTGPYVVSWLVHVDGSDRPYHMDCSTWVHACSVLHSLLLEGYTPSVAFA